MANLSFMRHKKHEVALDSNKNRERRLSDNYRVLDSL